MDECVSASKIGHPEFGMCCGHGKIKLPSLQVLLQPLYNLFTGNTAVRATADGGAELAGDPKLDIFTE